MKRITAVAAGVATTGVVVAGAALGLAGATSTTARPGTPPVRTAAALQAYESCTAFLSDTRRQAVAMVGPYGWTTSAGYGATVDVAEARAGTMPDSAPVAAAPAQSPSFSGTNVQEAGVDEPDIIKADGHRLFTLTGGALRALTADGGAPEVLGTLELGHSGDGQMLLSGDRMLVAWTTWSPLAPVREPQADMAPTSTVAPVGGPQVVLKLVDVSDPTHMTVLETMQAEGRMVSARLTGDSARLVVASAPGPVAFTSPDWQSEWGQRWAQALSTLRNRAMASQAGLRTWLPQATLERPGRATVRRPLVGCTDVRRPAAATGLGTLSVLTIDPARGLTPVDRDAVQTDAQTVYASPTSLYVATQRWLDPQTASTVAPEVSTQIHRFDTSETSRTEYRSTGTVPGTLIGQWAMSEDDGVLRVASTSDARWTGPSGEQQSQVTTLAERDGRLVRLGQVRGLGRGERIYAVRFIGDMGYVVTFRQTDPLYTVDVSDPAHPRVRGELKIPGYSAYLHPVGDGLILGVGQDATDEGRVQGTQVSLFDVSDPSNPRRVRQMRLGYGWSEAESDHHAFLSWPATGLVVLPFRDGYSGEAVGLHVDASGITRIGSVVHQGPWETPIRRSLVSGGTLYTVSDEGVAASDLDSLAPEGWVAFS